MGERMKRLAVAAAIFVALVGAWLAVSKEKALSAEELLQRMTLEQKVGQVMVGFIEGKKMTPELAARIKTVHLGGVILYSSGTGDNIDNPKQVAALIRDIQQTAVDAREVPLFVSIDQEGGRVSRLTKGVTSFPPNMAFGAAGNPKLVAKEAAIMARELRAIGVNVNYAPDVDVNSNPDNPVIGCRSYGSSPEEVARMAMAVIEPYKQAGVVCTAKHFPGHGDTAVDSHIGLPTVNHDRRYLEEYDFAPFKKMVEAGVPAVMTAHVVMPAVDAAGRPSTLSPDALSILRQELGFDGLIFTDALNMGAIVKQMPIEEAAIQAFLAGADVLLFGNDDVIVPAKQQEIAKGLADAVRSGRISRERLDDSVRRILRVKEEYGILSDPFPRETAELAKPEDTAFALQATQKSITLIKNNGLLPLTGKTKIPLILPAEYREDYGPLLEKADFLAPVFVPLKASAADIQTIGAAFAPDQTILVGAYELRKNRQWAQLIRAIGPARVVLLSFGTPYDLMAVPEVGGAVAVYGDMPVIQLALAEYLAGRIPAEGRLPVDLPGLYARGWRAEE